jgi:hypothetical protein
VLFNKKVKRKTKTLPCLFAWQGCELRITVISKYLENALVLKKLLGKLTINSFTILDSTVIVLIELSSQEFDVWIVGIGHHFIE